MKVDVGTPAESSDILGCMVFDLTLQGWRAIGWLGVLALVFLCVIPSPAALDELPAWSDKCYHSFAYGLLMWWLARGYPRRHWLALAIFLAVLGLAIEYLQSLTTYRTGSVFDELADLVGIGFGYLLAHYTPAGFPPLRTAE